MGDPVHVNPCSLRGITDSNFHPPILFKLNRCRDQSFSSRGRLDSQLQLLPGRIHGDAPIACHVGRHLPLPKTRQSGMSTRPLPACPIGFKKAFESTPKKRSSGGAGLSRLKQNTIHGFARDQPLTCHSGGLKIRKRSFRHNGPCLFRDGCGLNQWIKSEVQRGAWHSGRFLAGNRSHP